MIRNGSVSDTVETVTPDGLVCFGQKNKFSVGETLEAMEYDGTNTPCTVLAIYDEDGVCMESAPHPKQKLSVRLDRKLTSGVVIRRCDGD